MSVRSSIAESTTSTKQGSGAPVSFSGKGTAAIYIPLLLLNAGTIALTAYAYFFVQKWMGEPGPWIYAAPLAMSLASVATIYTLIVLFISIFSQVGPLARILVDTFLLLPIYFGSAVLLGLLNVDGNSGSCQPGLVRTSEDACKAMWHMHSSLLYGALAPTCVAAVLVIVDWCFSIKHRRNFLKESAYNKF